MADSEARTRALELWNEAMRFHMNHELERAVELYTKSIEVFPTAEAYTFRGWAFEGMGRIDDAIAECHRAIEVDPAFGNPYNDIGAYLIAKDELDEAIPWLEKAKTRAALRSAALPVHEPRPYLRRQGNGETRDRRIRRCAGIRTRRADLRSPRWRSSAPS